MLMDYSGFPCFLGLFENKIKNNFREVYFFKLIKKLN
jgi:hypothetical protein